MAGHAVMNRIRTAVKRGILIMFCVLTAMFSCGCSTILEGESLRVEPHVEPEASGSPDTVDFEEASTYEELKDAVMQLIAKRKETGLIRAANYEGDISQDIDQVKLDIISDEPLAAYAVFNISNTVNRIVSYYDVELSITYKKTFQQINGLSKVSTLRYLRLEILDMMKSYNDYSAYYTSFAGAMPENITEYVVDLYYENPLDIVVLPDVLANVYPDKGNERIIEIQLNYNLARSRLNEMTKAMQSQVKDIAGAASGINDVQIYLSLCRGLMERAEYNQTSQGSGDNSARYDYAATAYGALVGGNAVGEGYAMAFKALCDEMGLECYVVRGSLGSIPHAWNIVAVDGAFYHVDVSMCDVNGEETAFLLRDEDMKKDYWWDTKLYKTCAGELTYFDVVDL